MDGVSTTISKEWVGLILLPAISSVAGLFMGDGNVLWKCTDERHQKLSQR